MLVVLVGLTCTASPVVLAVRSAPSAPMTAWSVGMVVARSITIRPATDRINAPEDTSHDTLTAISDDGARVWMDGEVVPDAWAPHESRADRAHISGGKRRFKIQYYEVGGFAELRFDIQRR